MKDRILVEVDRKLVGMDMGIVLKDWSNVWVDKLVVVDGGVGKGLVNKEPDNQDWTLSHLTYLKIM